MTIFIRNSIEGFAAIIDAPDASTTTAFCDTSLNSDPVNGGSGEHANAEQFEPLIGYIVVVFLHFLTPPFPAESFDNVCT